MHKKSGIKITRNQIKKATAEFLKKEGIIKIEKYVDPPPSEYVWIYQGRANIFKYCYGFDVECL